jgi:Protein of unknown function (DUF1236)
MHKAPNPLILATVLSPLGVVALGLSVAAQTPPPQIAPPRRELPVAPKLNLTLEQRHTIREFIKDLRPEVAASRDVKADIGDPVPQGVDLQPMPSDVGRKVPQVRSHRFFIAGQQIVLVDPTSNKVADIINLREE